MTPIFLTSSSRMLAFLSSVMGLWARLRTRRDSRRSLYLTMTSNTVSLTRLLARLMLLTPCRNSVIFSKPVTVSRLLHSFSPLILWMRLALCTYSTTLSLDRWHSEMSKKSDSVFFENCRQIFSGSFTSNAPTSAASSLSLLVGLLQRRGEDRRELMSLTRDLWVAGRGEQRVVCFLTPTVLVMLRTLSFSMLLRDLISISGGVFLRVRLGWTRLLDFEMLRSASRLEVLRTEVLLPSMISELVQSRKGLASSFSWSFSGVQLQLLFATRMSPAVLPGGGMSLTSSIFSAMLLATSWLYLFISSMKMQPSVTISRGPSQQKYSFSSTLRLFLRLCMVSRQLRCHFSNLLCTCSNCPTAGQLLKDFSTSPSRLSIYFRAASSCWRMESMSSWTCCLSSLARCVLRLRRAWWSCWGSWNWWAAALAWSASISVKMRHFSATSFSKSSNRLKRWSLWLPNSAQCGQIRILQEMQITSAGTLCHPHCSDPEGTAS